MKFRIILFLSASLFFSAQLLGQANDKGMVINGIKWATRNVDKPGTFANNPEDSGMFYQRNRNVGWSTTDSLYNSNGGTVWDNSYAPSETWEKANDPCPIGWRIPTLDEIDSLLRTSKVSSQWTIVNDVNGRTFTDIATGSTIFLPAVGNYNGSKLKFSGSLGGYWSSKLRGINHGYFLHFHKKGASSNYDFGVMGYSIRCVSDK